MWSAEQCKSTGRGPGADISFVRRRFLSFWPALVPSFLNCLTLLGFLAINAILGGQTVSIASGSAMSWNVGIVVVGIISLIVRCLLDFWRNRRVV